MENRVKGCAYCDNKHICVDAFTDISPLCGAYDTSPAYKLEIEKVKREKDREDMINHLSNKVDWNKYTDNELDKILRFISRVKVLG